MKRIIGLLWVVLLMVCFSVFGQNANNWINFNQPYFKVQVAKTGVYRLTYSDLQAANFPVNSVDPRLVKLFHRGIEQAIFIQGEEDAIFNTSDFIEFFGEKNDGTLDRGLYKPSTAQPHSFYNLYSDTTAYFLTYSLIPPAGKRMATFSEVNVGLPKESFHNDQKLLVLTSNPSGGLSINNALQNTFFDQGEGWFGAPIQQNQTIDYTIDLISNTTPTFGSPTIEIQLVGRDDSPHSAEILVGANTGSLRSLTTRDFYGFETPVVFSSFNWTDIGSDGKMVVRVRSGPSTTNRFQLSTSYIKIAYPQNFNALGATEKFFNLTANQSANKSYIEIDNPAASMRLWDVTDDNNVSIITTRIVGSSLGAVVSNSSVPRNLYAASIVNTPIIKPVSFRPINPAAPNFLILSNRALMKPASGYSNVVQAYAAYRASTAGGKFDTLTISVDQLYDQFNYGETSSLAIYEFMKFMVAKGQPRFLFIIGKGRDTYSYSPYQRKPLATSEVRDLVPSAGSPASDMAYTAGLGNTTFEPKVATGRLPATTPAQVAAYLNKIIEIESAPLVSDWKKNGLHLSGGIQAYELPLFRSYVDGFKDIAKGNYWGGSISTIGKRESNPVQLINVSDQVNKGTNMITFFGHSSPGTIDVDIGFVSDPVLGYNNPGKYPVFLINGCNAGAFFLNGTIFGEDWILAANKGARNFIAHSSFGFSNSLQNYSNLFYSVGFADTTFIQKGIGEVQQEVAKRYLASYGSSAFSTTQVQQMVLLGDPAVKLFGTSKPDYAIDNNSLSMISLDGLPVTALSNSFGVKIIRKNGGATGTRTIPIRVIRTFADNTSKTYDSIFPNVLNQDTIIFKLKRELAGAGLNQISVVIDPLNTINEISKTNNTAIFNVIIPSNGTKNLFPVPFSIVNKQNVNLMFQSTDLNSSSRSFQIQLDTVATFNSPFLKSQVVSGKVLASYSASLLATDSMVYYWRAKIDKPLPNESLDWSSSSFVFIKNGSEGWGQLKFSQFSDNEVNGLMKDFQLKKLSYLETNIPVAVTTFGSGSSLPTTSVSIKINDVEYNVATQGQPCRTNTINFVAFSKNTAVPYVGIPFSFQDPRTCGREPQLINSFLLNELETGMGDDLSTYIDAIQQSDSVIIFSIGNSGFQQWSANTKSKLGTFGISSSQIESLQNGEPVIIFGKKGAVVGSAKIFRTSTTPILNQTLSVNKTMTGRFSSGTMKSTVIGPAKTWIRFSNQLLQVTPVDQYSFTIYGRSLTGTETLLKDNVQGNLDLGFISAQTYPYLKIVLNMKDEVNLTAIQLRKWIVEYERIAEGMLVFKNPIATQKVQEGQPFSSQYGFVNISDKLFPSQLSVRADVLTKTNGTTSSNSFLIDSPKPGDTTKFSVSIDSRFKVGLNDVSVFVNPRVLPEQYYDNNILNLIDYLSVVPDGTPPTLDVRIDGRTLRNYDFVSRSPKIEIRLKDDNPFLFKKDTLGVNIFLKKPCNSSACPYTPIYFKRNDVTWSPASSTDPYGVVFQPANLDEGVYTLRVAGTDASGNKSGANPYEVNFQITDTTALTLRSAYPNPSSDVVTFSFELRGNILPDDFRLRIFTLNGTLLSNFDRSNIQFFNIGTNEIRWPGRDLAGNNLPSGIYIYRLSVSANGKTSSQQGRLVLSK